MEREKVLEKCIALAKQAESTTFEAERDTALAMMAKLMGKYRIEQAEIEAAGRESQENATRERFVVKWPDPWKSRLARSIGDYLRVRPLWTSEWVEWKGRIQHLKVMNFFGLEADAAVAKLLYAAAHNTAEKSSVAFVQKRRAEAHGELTRKEEREIRLSYCAGFEYGLHEKFAAEMADLVQGDESKALVIVDIHPAVNELVDSTFPGVKIRSEKKSKAKADKASLSAVSAGYQEGRQFTLNTLEETVG